MRWPKLPWRLFHAIVSSSFLVATTGYSGAQQFISGRPYGIDGGSYATFTTDFNHDGKTDLVAATQNGISALVGNGDGTFQRHIDSAALTYGNGAAFGDFNNDGIGDIVLASHYYGYVSVSLGRPDGSFQPAQTVSCNHPFSLAGADLNLDGKLDLVATIVDNTAQGVSVLLGKGDGTFQPPVEYLAGKAPSDVHIADLDRDGKLDVLAIVAFTNLNINIRVWLGNGDGTLQAPMDSLVNAPAKVGALGDFNEDGILDLATSGDYYSNTAQLALGKGDGHFKSSIALPTGLAPNSVTTTDLNGDGHSDLVIGVSEDAEDIFLGNGDGTFQPRRDYNSGSSAAVPGDFNGDGKQDLIIPHNNVEFVLLG